MTTETVWIPDVASADSNRREVALFDVGGQPNEPTDRCHFGSVEITIQSMIGGTSLAGGIVPI
jgi:hypothetical protein